MVAVMVLILVVMVLVLVVEQIKCRQPPLASAVGAPSLDGSLVPL